MQPHYGTSQVSPLSLSFIHAHIVGEDLRRRQHLRNHLAQAGFEIEIAESASQAYPLIRKEPPALLVICDDSDTSSDALGILRWLSHQEFKDSVHTLVLCDTSDNDYLSKRLAESRQLKKQATQLLGEAVKALLKNADEALSNNVIEVDLETLALGEDTSLPLHPGDYLRITVLDQRAGIEAEAAERAFEPFFSTRNEAEGLGLTLGVCRTLQI